MSVNDEIIWKIKQIDSNFLYLGKAEAAKNINLINSYQIKTVLSITHTFVY